MVQNGKFALGHRKAVCLLSFGEPNRVAETCAFRCAQCQETLARCFMSTEPVDPYVENDPDILCAKCWSKCRLCGIMAACRVVRFLECCRYVCRGCIPDISENNRVTIIPVGNREF